MQSDEQLYELAAKELVESPRQGLLIKCMTNAEGDENKGKALYIKTRVEEIKIQVRDEQRKKRDAEKNKEPMSDEMKASERAGVIVLLFLLSIICMIVVIMSL